MLDQSQMPIVSALRESAGRLHAPFYAPGHKQGQGASTQLKHWLGEAIFKADLPELPELDNLFAPEGIIHQAQTLAAKAFGSEYTYFLVNGSTCGLEAVILATCGPGEKILVPRNAHRSVIAGLILAGAMPVFVSPEYNSNLGLALGMSTEAIATALTHHPDIRAVLLVSPTYHGICSDIATISQIAHAHGIPLLVDAAHGPHFGFHPDLPISALAQGADLVVQSTHKVLSAFSQASMLHGQGTRVSRNRLQAALQLTQSTSPSYLLLASLDAARHQIATEGKALLSDTLSLAVKMRAQLATIPGLHIIDKPDVMACASVSDLDLTRLTVDVSGLGITGLEADEILHSDLGVTVELPELRHLTLIISLGNTSADGRRCLAGFQTLARTCRLAPLPVAEDSALLQNSAWPNLPYTLPRISPRDAFFAPATIVPATSAAGRLSAETISAYPPGIPTLVAGEEITAAAIAYLAAVKQQGGCVTGCSDPSLTTLKVLNLED